MGLRDGDGWVRCDCGGHHWGLYGAAGLLLVRRDTPEPQVLLQLRANWTHGGGTWALPGGALDSHEDSIAAAKREAFEEVGVHEHHLTVVHTYSDDHGPWRYDTVIAHCHGDANAGIPGIIKPIASPAEENEVSLINWRRSTFTFFIYPYLLVIEYVFLKS